MLKTSETVGEAVSSPQVQTPAILLCHPYMGVQASDNQEETMSAQGHKSYHVNARQQEFQGGLLIYS